MSYHTSYYLTLENQSGSQTQSVTIEQLILEAKNGNISQANLVEKLEELKKGVVDVTEEFILSHLLSNNQDAKYFLTKNGNSTGNDGSWRDYEEELKSFSKKYPTWLFTLKGEGEEAMDLWVAYFLDGKMQKEKAKITFADFDAQKLR